jgi:hypothetical protein
MMIELNAVAKAVNIAISARTLAFLKGSKNLLNRFLKDLLL